MSTIFKTSESPSGKLICNVDGDEESVWMYLKDLDNDTIIGDAPICSLIPLLSLVDFKTSYKGKGAPPLVDGYISIDAVLPDMSNERIGVIWDSKESCVDVTIDSKPVSRIEKGNKSGFSIFIIKALQRN